MIGVCLAAAAAGLVAGATASLPLQTFTLAWTHSIEKIAWEEDYRVLPDAAGARLQLSAARVHGSGAGMEPPAGARLIDGVWHYQPQLAPLERLRLARSDYTADYRLCWDGACQPMAALLGAPASAPVVDVFACEIN